MIVALLLLASPKIDRLPPIAKIAGITIGVTTDKQFEVRYGKGKVIVGGHSNSGRIWYDRTTGVQIHADGFNYSKGGEILDGVEIDWEKGDQSVPEIRLRKTDLGILAKLKPGMTPAQVESALHLKLKNGVATQKGLVKYAERPINKGDDRYTTWEIRPSFGPKGLESVQVSAD